MKKNIGFIGLGIMGKPMSLNLIKAGHNLTVYDINKETVEKLVSSGAISASSPKEVAENSDIIFTMLPNSEHVKEVVLGESGIIKSAKKGTVVIDMSSITPVVSKEIASEIVEMGLEMLDAPV
ncbi:MAG: 2-hydroxy-3-oxopropionate reductase, partial [Clostridium sp.]